MKCEFDESNPHLPCVYCQKHGLSLTCEKVYSPSRQVQNNSNNVPSPASEPSEFRLSEICAYYEQLHLNATQQEIIAYLTKHVNDQQRRDALEAQEATAQAAAAALQTPYGQSAMVVPGQQPQYGVYTTASPFVGQYQQGYGTDQSQQYAVDPSLLQNQQTGTYYPQQQYPGYNSYLGGN